MKKMLGFVYYVLLIDQDVAGLTECDAISLKKRDADDPLVGLWAGKAIFWRRVDTGVQWIG